MILHNLKISSKILSTIFKDVKIINIVYVLAANYNHPVCVIHTYLYWLPSFYQEVLLDIFECFSSANPYFCCILVLYLNIKDIHHHRIKSWEKWKQMDLRSKQGEPLQLVTRESSIQK